MATRLLNSHRFLTNQSLYPLVLSSILALVIYGLRVVYSGSLNYSNLVWNLFLAWMPYGFSLVAAILFRLFSRQWWLLVLPGILWFIFLPNAPYIVTDFYHLNWRPPVPLWFDIGMIALFAWTGCFLAFASLRTMQGIVKAYTSWLVSWGFVAISLAFCGLGIYLGRFGRWNSWDVFFSPKEVLKDIAFPLINPLDNLRFVGFTLMFTAILLVIYLMFTSINRIEEPK